MSEETEKLDTVSEKDDIVLEKVQLPNSEVLPQAVEAQAKAPHAVEAEAGETQAGETHAGETHAEAPHKEVSRKEEVVIEVKNLYKIYSIGENKVKALNGVDFTINRGEFVAIVGTSGSGKSTLLNMLAGLEKPTKGEIIIAGEHLEKKNEANLVMFRQKHIGFIFQSYNLLQTMDAIENVALPLVFRGEDSIIRRQKAIKRLKQVGLSKFMDHKPGQMSGGQQQRVGIARALVVDPEIIFADEPTGNLDSKTSLEVMNLMQNLSRLKNQTIVMVTHDNYLAGFADKLIRIKDGKIIELLDNRNSQNKATDEIPD